MIGKFFSKSSEVTFLVNEVNKLERHDCSDVIFSQAIDRVKLERIDMHNEHIVDSANKLCKVERHLRNQSYGKYVHKTYCVQGTLDDSLKEKCNRLQTKLNKIKTLKEEVSGTVGNFSINQTEILFDDVFCKVYRGVVKKGHTATLSGKKLNVGDSVAIAAVYQSKTDPKEIESKPSDVMQRITNNRVEVHEVIDHGTKARGFEFVVMKLHDNAYFSNIIYETYLKNNLSTINRHWVKFQEFKNSLTVEVDESNKLKFDIKYSPAKGKTISGDIILSAKDLSSLSDATDFFLKGVEAAKVVWDELHDPTFEKTLLTEVIPKAIFVYAHKRSSQELETEFNQLFDREHIDVFDKFSTFYEEFKKQYHSNFGFQDADFEAYWNNFRRLKMSVSSIPNQSMDEKIRENYFKIDYNANPDGPQEELLSCQIMLSKSSQQALYEGTDLVFEAFGVPITVASSEEDHIVRVAFLHALTRSGVKFPKNFKAIFYDFTGIDEPVNMLSPFDKFDENHFASFWAKGFGQGKWVHERKMLPQPMNNNKLNFKI